MNIKKLDIWNIIEEKDVPSKYNQKYNDVLIPCSKHGDVWCLVKNSILKMKVTEFDKIEAFSSILLDADVDSFIDIINTRYPRCNRDEETGEYLGYDTNATVADILDIQFIHDNEDNTSFIKSGIYNQYCANGTKAISRDNPTTTTEFNLFMALVLLSGYDIVVDETVFLEKPFIETIE